MINRILARDTHISTVLPKEPLKSTWMVNGASLLLEEVRQDIQFPVADGDVNGSNGAESGETTSVVAGVSMVDASKIASIAVTNGNTGEQKTVTGKKAYSDEYLA